MNNDILNWWLNYKPMSEEELKTFLEHRPSNKEIVSTADFQNIKQQYINRLPNSGLTTDWDFKVSDCATDFIKYLFATYVDEDTLVITTQNEHNNVREEITKCKNVLFLDSSSDNSIILKPAIVKDKCQCFKKVFVYIIGTHITTGIPTPQYIFETLKSILADKQTTFVLDAVQEMFLYPRNYSMFDYVIGTAHALIKQFDMGMCWSKHQIGFGSYIGNWAQQYLKNLDILLCRKDKMFMFKTVMQDVLYDFLGKVIDTSIVEKSAPYFFSARINSFPASIELYDMLKPLYVRLEGIGTDNLFLRLRGQQFITHPDYLKNGLDLLYDYMEMVMENE